VAARSAERTSGPLSPALREALSARARPDGLLPFDRFLDVVLYGDGVGYYRRRTSPFGPTGDFYTAPRVSPLYARTVARRVAEVREAVSASLPFAIVDLGAGDGTLLRGILEALSEAGKAMGIEAVVVERSPELRATAAAGVAAAADKARVPVVVAGSLAELGPSVGVVLAHELLDAQPARQLRWDGSGWTEAGFRLRGGRLEPAEAPLEGDAVPADLPTPGPEDAGVVVELSAAAEALVREVADHLAGGELLVTDYGDEQSVLIGRHPHGTVAAVRSHRAAAGPLDAPGETDLSTFVNFSRIRAAAGLTEVAYRGQAEALGAWGFEEELRRSLAGVRSAEEEVRLRLAAKNLLFGFGSFRVLELAPRATAEALRPG
jgi:SAM-dependent MidA family methyltransferase